MRNRIKTVFILLIVTLSACNNSDSRSESSYHEKFQEEELNESKSPIFSVGELIKLLEYNPDEIDTYLLEKGYKLSLNESERHYEAYLYKYFNVDGSSDYSITYTRFEPGFQSKMSLGWHPKDEKEYLNIKSELKELGFEYLNSNSMGERTFFTYRKGNIIGGLQVGLVDGTTIYTIDIRDVE